MPFSSRFPTIIPIIIINPLNSKEMNNKKKNEGRTDFSYYGLYLLDYLTTNKFEQAADEAFIRERTDRAAGDDLSQENELVAALFNGNAVILHAGKNAFKLRELVVVRGEQRLGT